MIACSEEEELLIINYRHHNPKRCARSSEGGKEKVKKKIRILNRYVQGKVKRVKRFSRHTSLFLGDQLDDFFSHICEFYMFSMGWTFFKKKSSYFKDH